MSQPTDERLTRAAVAADLSDRVFAPVSVRDVRPRIGAEVEVIPVDAETRRVVPVDGGSSRTSMRLLRDAAVRLGWVESVSYKGVPAFTTPEGGTVGFEPGGQIEYSSAARYSASALIADVRGFTGALESHAADLGIELLTLGLDPLNRCEHAAMHLHADRYTCMADYFATIGTAGRRMMRQTAALQISVDLTDDPVAQWRVSNALAPWLVAMFANSRRCAGAATEWQSARAENWRYVDPARTGLCDDPDSAPAAWYSEFALAAPAMMRTTPEGEYLPFGSWLDRGETTSAQWREHLTTLFPEVRPRGHLELRSPDALQPQWYAAPIAFASGLLYHAPSRAAASELLGAPDAELLRSAGRYGLRTPAIGRVAGDLVDLALTGCEALGDAWMCADDLDGAREFFERFTRQGRSPADDGV